MEFSMRNTLTPVERQLEDDLAAATARSCGSIS
jgi:hypothetical protein